MMFCGKKFALATLLISVYSLDATALLIEDNYAGGGDMSLAPYNYSRDVLGGDLYEVYSMDVTTSGTSISVTINTNFLESDPGNTGGFVVGDLFISTDGWNPYEGVYGAPYYEDTASNGTTWEYAFDSSSSELLAITAADIDLVESTECCRIGQETLVTGGTDTGAGEGYSGAVASDSGTWDYEYTYTFDYDALGLIAGDTLGLHWVMSCGNDVIEGAYTIPSVSVPEPGSLALLAFGVLALGVSRRKVA